MPESQYVPKSSRYHIYVLLMLSGGMMGAFSYLSKGGVFANAETANCLLFAANLAMGNLSDAMKLLFPISAFFIGAVFSEMMKDRAGAAWTRILLIGSMLLLGMLAFLPEGTPYPVYHMVITFISANIFNTFRSARGVAMSTLFCTAHLRSAGAALYQSIKSRKWGSAKIFLYHIGMILTFMLGTFICAESLPYLGDKAVALSIVPLIWVYAEISAENQKSRKKKNVQVNGVGPSE